MGSCEDVGGGGGAAVRMWGWRWGSCENVGDGGGVACEAAKHSDKVRSHGRCINGPRKGTSMHTL